MPRAVSYASPASWRRTGRHDVLRGRDAACPCFFQAAGRAINESVRLYARVGAALIATREAGQDPFKAITAVIPWERFRASVAEAEALARPEDFDSYEG